MTMPGSVLALTAAMSLLSPASATMAAPPGSSFIVLAQAMIPRTGMMDAENPMPMKERYLKRFPQPARVRRPHRYASARSQLEDAWLCATDRAGSRRTNRIYCRL